MGIDVIVVKTNLIVLPALKPKWLLHKISVFFELVNEKVVWKPRRITLIKGQNIYKHENGNTLRVFWNDNAPQDTEKTMSERERRTYENIIVALLDCINGELPQTERHPSFSSEAKMILSIEKHFKGYQGLNETTLKHKFAESRKKLKDQ